jgi:hypothetical protein
MCLYIAHTFIFIFQELLVSVFIYPSNDELKVVFD